MNPTHRNYNEIVKVAKSIKKNVSNNYKLGENEKWGYYIAKAILKPKTKIKRISFDKAPKPRGTHISRQLSKSEVKGLAKDLIEFVEGPKKRMPNYLTYKSYKIRTRLYIHVLAKALVFYDENGRLPNEVNINSKAFYKPSETKNDVYNYFVKTFGSFGNTIDGALSKVQGRGYSYYYDDVYSNKQSIDRLKKGQGINCTDSCHVFYNIMLQLIKLGKYKKVECLHVQCQSGGHVKLRITLNDGSKIIRDPACVISDNGLGINCVWCTNTPIAVNPGWFMENLNR